MFTGRTGDRCVLFSAHDGLLRDYHLYVQADCCASISIEANERALALMRRNMGADTTPSTALDVVTLRAGASATSARSDNGKRARSNANARPAVRSQADLRPVSRVAGRGRGWQ